MQMQAWVSSGGSEILQDITPIQGQHHELYLVNGYCHGRTKFAEKFANGTKLHIGTKIVRHHDGDSNQTTIHASSNSNVENDQSFPTQNSEGIGEYVFGEDKEMNPQVQQPTHRLR